MRACPVPCMHHVLLPWWLSCIAKQCRRPGRACSTKQLRTKQRRHSSVIVRTYFFQEQTHNLHTTCSCTHTYYSGLCACTHYTRDRATSQPRGGIHRPRWETGARRYHSWRRGRHVSAASAVVASGARISTSSKEFKNEIKLSKSLNVNIFQKIAKIKKFRTEVLECKYGRRGRACGEL